MRPNTKITCIATKKGKYDKNTGTVSKDVVSTVDYYMNVTHLSPEYAMRAYGVAGQDMIAIRSTIAIPEFDEYIVNGIHYVTKTPLQHSNGHMGRVLIEKDKG